LTRASEAESLIRRVAETVTWCRAHVSVADPKNSLRTVALRPGNLREIPGGVDYVWGREVGFRTGVEAVDDLVDRRGELLRREGNSPGAGAIDLRGGRLLIHDPEDSDQCGLSESDSGYFIDIADVPAWDTWIDFRYEDRIPSEVDERFSHRATWSKVTYLLCWVPAEFIPLVDRGIMVNPVECFFWASEYRRRGYDTETLRRLESVGLLAG